MIITVVNHELISFIPHIGGCTGTPLQQKMAAAADDSGWSREEASTVVDLRVTRKRKTEASSPSHAASWPHKDGDHASADEHTVPNTDFSPTGAMRLEDLFYLATMQMMNNNNDENKYACTGLPQCACVQCLRRWPLGTKLAESSTKLLNVLDSVTITSDASPPAASHQPGKFKQALMQRYLEDGEQLMELKLRRQSGSLGSEDGQSSPECTSPLSRDPTEDPSQLATRLASNR